MGGQARGKITARSGAVCNQRFIGPMTLALWNCRSLWAQGSTETIHFMLELVRAHGITVLTETRESKERLAFLRGMLPNDVSMYSSRLDQYKGGVAVIVQSRFLQSFAAKPKWKVFSKGRLARLEFSGAAGRLHVYAIYLSPDSPEERDAQIMQLASILDRTVHNMIAGDFNFVSNDCDRMSKVDGESRSNAADNRNAMTWQRMLHEGGLQEFQQSEFTCENSYGWSKIDRIYTNLHVADLCSMQCSCNLLMHPRHLSDHRPVSVSIAFNKRRNKQKTIPRWATEHPKFMEELTDEFLAKCEDFKRYHGFAPQAFDKLQLLKKSAHRVYSFIRRMCNAQVAETVEHKLAVGMAFLRAVRLQDFEKAKALQKKCVDLHHLKVGSSLIHSQELEHVKDLIVTWMRSDIRVRAEELKTVRQTLPEVVYQKRKNCILSSLKRMLPAGSGDIAAMIDSDGNIATETDEIARVLNTHWQQVFDWKPTNRDLRLKWLELVKNKFQLSKEQLRPTKAIVTEVINELGDSAAGPDAIPFEVYKQMGEMGVDLFWEVANAMLDGLELPGEDFNLALMVCIPKCADGLLEDNMPYYAPGGTRPISIVDSANRILASIFCAVLERKIGHRLERAQKGFLKGRHLLRNVLDVDFAAHKISVRSRSGAIILFDFAAAFPSVSHEMLWDALEATGIDANFIKVVKLFYRGNQHFLKLRGSRFLGIEVKSGVRQGCPLSGLLFAICVDVLLTRMAHMLKNDEVVAAFADDIALVLEDFWVSAPAIQKVFQEFQEVSGLILNISKTVLIPLWPFSGEANVRVLLRELCPDWRDLQIARSGKYLGFILGPNATQDGWKKPLAKFERTVALWATLRLGMSLNVHAFNVYMVPILEYVAQLLIVDEPVQDAMLKAMRKLASGPGNWIVVADMENLTSFGFPSSFKTIDLTAKAAKLRLCMTVAADASRRCEELNRAQCDSLRRPFGTWHKKSFFQILNQNCVEMTNLGISIEDIRRAATTKCQQKHKVHHLQKCARHRIVKLTSSYNVEFRIRHKMDRWKFDGPPAIIASRILRNFQLLGRTCRPCVTSAYFKALWNGWPTTWRMRTLPDAAEVTSCLLGCETAVDRIEHYLVCPIAWKAFQQHGDIKLKSNRKCLQSMLLATQGLQDEEVRAIAISIYALAKTIHTIRASGPLDPHPLLNMYLQEGLRRANC